MVGSTESEEVSFCQVLAYFFYNDCIIALAAFHFYQQHEVGCNDGFLGK